MELQSVRSWYLGSGDHSIHTLTSNYGKLCTFSWWGWNSKLEVLYKSIGLASHFWDQLSISKFCMSVTPFLQGRYSLSSTSLWIWECRSFTSPWCLSQSEIYWFSNHWHWLDLFSFPSKSKPWCEKLSKFSWAGYLEVFSLCSEKYVAEQASLFSCSVRCLPPRC